MRVRKTASASAAIAGAALVSLATPAAAQAQPGDLIDLGKLTDTVAPGQNAQQPAPPKEVAPPAPPKRVAPPAPPAPPKAGSEGTITGTVPGTHCSTQAQACLSLSHSRAVLIKNGKVVYGPVPITTGKPGEETPLGMHHVQWKDIDHRSKQFNNAPMNYSVFFTNGIAFHEGDLNEQSNGCVHLSTAAAKKFYETLDVGDAVQVIP